MKHSEDENPYRPGNTTAESSEFRLMSLRTVRFVLLTGALGAVIGCLLGAAVGAIAPAYYAELFNSRGDADFSAIRTGTGLGLFQGFGGGVCLGAFLAVAEAWLMTRRPSAHFSESAD